MDRKMATLDCTVCSETGSRYKCPRCIARYCSVVCFKRHKEDACKDQAENSALVSEPTPSITVFSGIFDQEQSLRADSNIVAREPVLVPSAPSYYDTNLTKEETARRVERLLIDIPEESRLRKSALDSLNSPDIAASLSDPAIRNFVTNAISSPSRREAHERIRNLVPHPSAIPGFSSLCLNVVNKGKDM